MLVQKWSRIVRAQSRLWTSRAYATMEGRGPRDEAGFESPRSAVRDGPRGNSGKFNDRPRFNNRFEGSNNRFNARSDNRYSGRDNRYNGRSENRFNNRRDGRYSRNGQDYGRSRGNARSNYGRNDREDYDLIERTQSRRFEDDGLMGQPDYELNRDLSNMKWTDLVAQDIADADELVTKGFSHVPTKALADHRLLSLPLVNSLIKRKYEWLTPVQAQTLLPILRNESCVVRAKTGTGKTAAFSIPAIQKVLEAKKQGIAENKVKVLILSPTRELAQQIADEVFKITNFGGLNKVKVQSLVGGMSKRAQMDIAGLQPNGRNQAVADIIVATPGRLMDILQEPGVAERFNELQLRVFDEADRILDIGFERTVDDIRGLIDDASEPGRSTPLLLFSATADRTVRRFAQSQFGDRVYTVDTVPKNEPSANELVNQVAVACPTWSELYEGAAREILASYTKAQEEGTHFKAIVFLPTVAMTDHFQKLISQTIPSKMPLRRAIFAVHGSRTQAARQRNSDDFRKLRDSILLTTDVVARGMDFPLVTHVFQLGVPPDVSSYVHRIGRTARIGNKGTSFLFYTNHVRAYIDALAREGITPTKQLFEPEPEFHEQFLRQFIQSVPHDEDAQDLIHSLMSYMSVLKSKYRVNAAEFLRDMLPFAELMGMTEVPLSSSMRQVWNTRSKAPRRTGSSRKSRMRW